MKHAHTGILILILLLSYVPLNEAQAQCAATTRTWTAGNNNNQWSQNGNWTVNRPDSNVENALVQAASRPCRTNLNTSISCLEVISGELRSNNTTLTLTGDYFRAHSPNTINARNTTPNWWIVMAGGGDQTVEIVDRLWNLRISNNNNVRFTHAFAIRDELDLTGTTTTLDIEDDLELEAGGTLLTIPTGVTVTVESGATLTANSGITVNGTLVVESGASVILANGQTLTIAAGGRLEVNGTSGNAATIASSGSGNTFTFDVAGTVNASYFRFDRMTAAGVNITGTIEKMENGEFHYIANAGYALTFGAAVSAPANMDDLGFYDDDGHGNTQNVDATAYNVSNVMFDNYSGSVGGEANDNDAPGNRIDWGTPAGTRLTISDNTAAGSPPAVINQSSGDTLFATFAFALTAADTATNITSVTLTQNGSASNGDIATLKVFSDVGGATNCVYEGGSDTQIGSDLTFSGSPGTATVSINPGDVQTSSDTDLACIHVTVDTSATAQDEKTIQIRVDATGDVTNSQAYAFSDTAGPPVQAGSSEINGSTVQWWEGDVSSVWNVNGNWRGAGFPNSTKDCQIGVGVNITDVSIVNAACQNMTLQSGGTIDWNNTTNTLDAYGNLTIESGYNFNNFANGTIRMMGSNNQSINADTAFPNDLEINNTGGAGNNIVTFDSDATLNTDLIITAGVVVIPDGVTVSVAGNVAVNGTSELEIEGGGTLEFTSNNATLTVVNGATLTIVGSSGKNAIITTDANTKGFSASVAGTIAARYYTMSRLDTNGLTITGTATIDGTNHLQDCNFSYPVPAGVTMLSIGVQVPTDTMDNCSFSSGGSGSAITANIDTTGVLVAGPLVLDSYTGDLAGPPNPDVDPVYLLNWTNASNTMHITREAASPATVDAGDTHIMGRFGFEQELAGASFNDADITQLIVELTGTGDSFDVDDVRIYYDDDCDSSGGTQIGSGAPSGNPARVTFNIAASSATVQADVATPPLRCIYVEYAMSASARDGRTIGAQITSSLDITNDQTYGPSSATTFPVTLNTPSTINGSTLTRWTGTFDTNWHDPLNWTNGVPTNAQNCIIDNVANDPIINGGNGIANCDSITIGSGHVTMQDGTGAILDFYGNFDNTGTITYNSDGTLRVADTGTSSDQTLTSTQAIDRMTFAKTLGGTLTIGGTSATITNLTMPGGNSFEFRVGSGKTLTLPNGVSIVSGTLNIQGGGTLEIGNGQTLSVAGGTFQTSGTNDAYPQSTANKGTVTVDGAGTWNFSATSGTVTLTGFVLDYLSTAGAVFSGTTNLTALDGGQLTNLSNSYASVVGFTFNTSSVPATATNVGWNWGPSNTPPSSAAAYTLAASTGCGSNTITFDQWFGDFFIAVNDPDTDTKISEALCDIIIDAAASPANLLAFEAKAYDEAIRLSWRTGLESDHRGFNVYRSRYKFHGYDQINTDLVLNDINSTSFHGDYVFDDSNLQNGMTYYYMIEDIAINGAKTLHGPVSATPEAVFGSMPAPSSSENHDTNTVGDNPSTPGGGLQNEGGIEISPGVEIVSETQSSLVIEITPGSISWSASPLNGSYDQASINGYSRNSEAGQPEYLQKTLLIPVEDHWDTASLSNQELIQSTTITDKTLAAAPDYLPDGNGELQPQWTLDASTYALNQLIPTNNIEVESDLVNLQGRKFIRLVVHPIRYNPSLGHTEPLQRARLFVDLTDADPAPVSGSATIPVAATDSVVRITLQSSGLYEVSYDDMSGIQLDWVFNGSDPDDLRLYFADQEIPMEVIDSNNLWDSGDSLRFYFDHTNPSEDVNQYFYLADFDVLNSSDSPLRVASIDGDPSAIATAVQNSTQAFVELEQNNNLVLDTPMGPEHDHFFWDRFSRQQGQPATSASFFDFSASLPEIDRSRDVIVTVTVHARATDSRNSVHDIALWANSNPSAIATAEFPSREVSQVRFTVPGAHFIASNSLRLEAIASHLNSGEFGVFDVDKVRIDYYRTPHTDEDQLLVYSPDSSERTKLSGFSSNSILVYDISSYESFGRYNNLLDFDDSGSCSIDLIADDSFHDDAGYRLVALEQGQIKTPVGLQVQKGYSTSTFEGGNFDMLMIGPSDLEEQLADLQAHREAQGLSVHYYSYQQIYDEWNHGTISSKAIKEFLNSIKDSQLKYVLFIGDTTFDPKNHMAYSFDHPPQPYPFIQGKHVDFGSDNYYVTTDSSSIPFTAVGRIPSSDPQKVSDYVQKVIDYENGVRAPLDGKRFDLISDNSLSGEDFDQKGDNLVQSFRQSQSEFSFQHYKYNSYSNVTQLTDEITGNIIPSAPLLVNYLGHGAENLWGNATTILDTSHINTMNNHNLPIVTALNCLNANFYFEDPSYESLGESFILNEKGGAIAFWGSSAMTVPNTQIEMKNYFQEQLYQAVKDNPNRNVRLGDLMLQAKVQLGDRAFAKDTVNSWMLFGDPAMKLPESAYIDTPAAPTQAAAPQGGGGCSAFGSQGHQDRRLNDLFLELIFLLMPVLLLYGIRRRFYNS